MARDSGSAPGAARGADIGGEILAAIRVMTDRKVAGVRPDRTFRSVVEEATPRGYVISDESGVRRTVGCSIPGAELRPGQAVWVKIPCSDIGGMHICGIR